MKPTRTESATNAFKSGLNCAQSVLTTYSEKFNFDKNLALQISSGFGGGMGRMQETCGAVTGAFMVFGVYNANKFTKDSDSKESTNTMIQAFSEQFKSVHGTLDCKSLLNCDINTEEGQLFLQENKLNETVCEKCVADSIQIIDELIGD